MVEKYQYLVSVIARPYFLAGAEAEDLQQEGRIGLLRAVRTYKDKHGVQFPTYASRCIRNAILKAITKAQGGNNNMIKPLENLDFEGVKEDVLENEVYYKYLLDQLLRGVGPRDYEVVELFLQGFSYEEIAQKLSLTVKAVDNKIQKIRKKYLANVQNQAK